jgi:hypothetical protein
MNGIPIFDGIRSELRSRWPEWTAVSLFAAVVAFAIPYHEPWADEAQAWQLARSLSLGELFQTYIRHEATPGLWYFFLRVLNCAHVSYTGMHWICGVIAVVSTSLLVFLSPLPRYLKLTFPFTFFLLFQYSVIARSYVLVPVLLFGIAYWWRKSPLTVSTGLGLLANCALHAAVISGGLAIVWLIEQLRTGRAGGALRRGKLPLCVLIVLGFYAFALWTAWPPSDLASDISYVRALRPSFIDSVLVAALSPVCQPAILSIVFWIVFLPVFWYRKSLLYLLPVLFLEIFCGAAYCSFWHWGLVVPLIISLLWMTWPVPGSSVPSAELVGRAALTWMIGTQILWSGYAIVFDHFNAYSPNLAAAQFLMPRVKAGATIAITYLDDSPSPYVSNNMFSATGILPYFDRSIYINQPDPFYLWSDKNSSDALFNAILPSHPSIVVAETLQVGSKPPTDLAGKRAELLMKSGYRLTNVFCGSVPFQTRLVLTNCHVIYQYAGDAP